MGEGHTPPPRAPTLAHLLATAAERSPDRAAVLDGEDTTTWAEAAERTGQLAAALAELGVERGDRVGVHHRKSTEGFLAMHAVVAAGAVAVPLDPTASPGYLASVVEQTGCSSIVTHEQCRTTAETLAAMDGVTSVIGIDAAGDHPGAASCRYLGPGAVAGLDPRPPADLDPTAPAYIITTSGSTGRPKGICHTHASALAYVDFTLAAYDYGADDRISDLAPNHFDISTQALWVTPAIAATNVVIPEQHQMFPASLTKLMADSRLTVWYGVPYLLTQLLARGGIDQHDLTSLRWVLFGGEVATPGMLAQLMERLPGARFSNIYGPAEVNACTVHHLDRPPVGDEPIPIGRPFAATEVRLVDPASADPDPLDATATATVATGGPRPDPLDATATATVATGGPRVVDPGAQGEIWVRAATMMRSYWGRTPAASGIVEWDGACWYRTGDLGTERGDGELVFAGRVDHQVKVRGYRVELESIEAVLEDAAGVVNAIATVARSDDGSDVIIAGIVTDGDGGIDLDQLGRWAREHLPHYAVPAHFYPVGSMPVTGSGKLDRRAIRHGLVGVHDGEGP